MAMEKTDMAMGRGDVGTGTRYGNQRGCVGKENLMQENKERVARMRVHVTPGI